MVSGYRIQTVIRAYMENMKMRVTTGRVKAESESVEDRVAISQESIRMLLLENVEKHLARRVAVGEVLRLPSGGPVETDETPL